MSPVDKGKLELKLPSALTGRAHLARLIRELEVVENDFERQKVVHRTKAAKEGKHVSGKDAEAASTIPNMSQALSDCIELNKVDITKGQERMRFKAALGQMKDKAPIMHFTFATEPDGESLQRLADWIRKEIHPQALISVGVQPAIVGGVYLRTPNHVRDMSLRALLQNKREFIANELETLRVQAMNQADQAQAQAQAKQAAEDLQQRRAQSELQLVRHAAGAVGEERRSPEGHVEAAK